MRLFLFYSYSLIVSAWAFQAAPKTRPFDSTLFSRPNKESDETNHEAAAVTPETPQDLQLQQRARMAAHILSKTRTPPKTGKDTSVGTRRVGSASRARNQPGASTRLMDSLRKSARAATNNNNNNNNKSETTKMSIETSVLHTTIVDMLRSQQQQQAMTAGSSSPMHRVTAAFSNFGRSIGVLGEPIETTTECSPKTLMEDQQVLVRIATPEDDVNVANLRLSVFSNFPAEVRGQFCARSCQAIASRRLRGARCIVAMTANGATLGSAECSFHEFFGTTLGLRRPRGSLLYLTEVAVHPSARRRGIGRQLLQAMDQLAKEANSETLYLHVDVRNDAAIKLYEKAGYRRVKASDRMYLDFTTSLNLHSGATKGRDHYLYYKNIEEPTWLTHEEIMSSQTKIGFEIPC